MRWEYKVIEMEAERLEAGGPGEHPLEAGLNELGATEWELVAVVPSSNRTRGVVAVLKRPRDGSMW